MAPAKDQGECFIILGIFLIAIGVIFGFVFILLAFGVFVIIIGVCFKSQQQQQAKTAEAQSAPQPVAQTAPQSAPLPAPAPINEVHQFCPQCGMRTTRKFCSKCGCEID